MKQTILVVGALVLTLGAERASGTVELHGASDITVREEGPFETVAGELRGTLVKYLKLALGREDLQGVGRPVEFVLRTSATYWHQLPPETLADIRNIDAFEIEIVSEPQGVITITGQTPLATGYGVMAFLEEYLGLHWAFPGELGLCVPPRRAFVLKEGRLSVRPFVFGRVMSGLVLQDPAGERKPRAASGVAAQERSFFSAGDFFKSMRMHQEAVTHNMIRIFPIEESLKNWPEIFPRMEDSQPFVPDARARGEGTGGQNSYQAWHPCYTHPRTLEVAVTKGRETFAEGRLLYSLGINDGERVHCQCAECRRAGWPQAYYQFVNRVADALRDAYPPRMVGVLAYGDVGLPPPDLALRENVLVNVAGDRHSLWRGKAPRLGTYEYVYGAGYVLPNLPFEIIQENFRYYQAHDLLLYRAEAYPVWAFDAPKLYVIRHLLWDPKADVHWLVRQYCDRTFGAAGAAMNRYYLAAGSWRPDSPVRDDVTPVWGKEWPFKDPLQFHHCPLDYHARLEAALREAAACEITEAQRQRLDMVAAFTEFSAVYTEIWRCKEAVFGGGLTSARAAESAAALAKREDAIMARLRKHPEWFCGSSVHFDDLTRREWPLTQLECQLQTAIVTARHPMASPGADAPVGRAPSLLLPLARKEHPRYKPDQTVAMGATRGVLAGFRFKTVPNEVIDSPDDPRRHGRYKAQWLHATSRDLPAESSPLVLEVTMKGAAGMLRIEAEGNRPGSQPAKQTLAECLVSFQTTPSEATRRFVIDLVSRGVTISDPSNASAEDAIAKLQLHFLWRPDQAEAWLEGAATLRALPP